MQLHNVVRVLTYCVLGLLLTAQGSLASSFCIAGNTYCAIGTPSADGTSICFTVQSSAQGWVGLGLGSSQMRGADIYVGWKNSTGGTTLFNGKGVATSQPSYALGTGVKQAAVDVASTPSWAKITFSFCRPMSVTSNTNYIYAFSDSGPTDKDSPTSSFPQHSKFGTFAHDFTTTDSTANGQGSLGPSAILQLPEGTTLDYIWRVHGILMFIAWGISPFAGVFVARFLKDFLGIWWYRLHLFFMLGLTGGLALSSIVLIYLYTTPDPSHFESDHAKLGLSLVVLMMVQFVLGFISNHMWTPDRTSIPLIDKLHWFVGRSLILIGIVNVYLGLQLYDEDYPISPTVKYGYWVLIGFEVLVLVGGEFRIGPVHHLKGKSGGLLKGH